MVSGREFLHVVIVIVSSKLASRILTGHLISETSEDLKICVCPHQYNSYFMEHVILLNELKSWGGGAIAPLCPFRFCRPPYTTIPQQLGHHQLEMQLFGHRLEPNPYLRISNSTIFFCYMYLIVVKRSPSMAMYHSFLFLEMVHK